MRAGNFFECESRQDSGAAVNFKDVRRIPTNTRYIVESPDIFKIKNLFKAKSKSSADGIRVDELGNTLTRKGGWACLRQVSGMHGKLAYCCSLCVLYSTGVIGFCRPRIAATRYLKYSRGLTLLSLQVSTKLNKIAAVSAPRSE